MQANQSVQALFNEKFEKQQERANWNSIKEDPKVILNDVKDDIEVVSYHVQRLVTENIHNELFHGKIEH